jgi:hypothetical protein
MDFEVVGVRREDLSYRLASAAHSGTSFSRDERDKQEQQAYYEDIKNIYDLFADRIAPEQEMLFLEEMTRYKRANFSGRLDYLHSRSRILSAMITGPAKFPTRRNEKRSRAYENKVSAFTEWRKGGNKPESLREANLTKLEQDEITSHFKYGMADKPYPSWSLTNNNAKIRRPKERLEGLKAKQADQTTDTEMNGVRIVDNVEEKRLQMFFPGKPSETVRSELKRNGLNGLPQ